MDAFDGICKICQSGPHARLMNHIKTHKLTSQEYRDQTGYQGPMVDPEVTRSMNHKSNSLHTPARRAKQSRSLRVTYAETDLRNHRSIVTQQLWDSGKRTRNPLSQLRKDLRERAKDCCEECGISQSEHLELTGRSLSLHHISYDKTVPDLDQVLLLCDQCHRTLYHPKREYGKRQRAVFQAVTRLLDALGADLCDENFLETPRRFGQYLIEHFLVDSNDLDLETEVIEAATFPSSYDGVVIETDIQVFGICPHHLMPIIYKFDIGYIPNDSAIGLSKIARIAEMVGKQPDLQENVTKRIATVLQQVLGTQDVAVICRGQHFCMIARGVKSNALTTTSVMLGRFLDEPSLRQEFLELARKPK